MSENDKRLLDSIVDYGQRLIEDESHTRSGSVHFQHTFGAYQYFRICGEVAVDLGRGKRILDWGAGWGQNTFLLAKFGLSVTSFDVRSHYRDYWDLYPEHKAVCHIGDSGGRLPFDDLAFDGVLSCGVLEHVPDDRRSLSEVHRVLADGGMFYIYHLPNKYSISEFASKLLGRYHHRRKYTISSATKLLEEGGFEVVRIGYHHFLPRIIVYTPLTRSLLDKYYLAFERFDAFLSHLPFLKNFCTAIEMICRKR